MCTRPKTPTHPQIVKQFLQSIEERHDEMLVEPTILNQTRSVIYHHEMTTNAIYPYPRTPSLGSVTPN